MDLQQPWQVFLALISTKAIPKASGYFQASISSEEIIPYSGVFRCPATITYATRADTTTRTDFDAKFQEVLQVMYQEPNLASVLTTATLKVFLANVTSESPDIRSENRTWAKTISLDISCTSI